MTKAVVIRVQTKFALYRVTHIFSNSVMYIMPELYRQVQGSLTGAASLSIIITRDHHVTIT